MRILKEKDKIVIIKFNDKFKMDKDHQILSENHSVWDQVNFSILSQAF